MHERLACLAGSIDRGLRAVHDTPEAMRPSVEDVRSIQATLEPESGTWAQRQARFEVLQEPCQKSDEAIQQHRGHVMGSFAPGLFVGGEETDRPQDSLDLERWFKPPKGHERRRHGHRRPPERRAEKERVEAALVEEPHASGADYARARGAASQAPRTDASRQGAG